MKPKSEALLRQCESGRDEEVEELKRRVAYLQSILTKNGLKHNKTASIGSQRDASEEKKEEDVHQISNTRDMPTDKAKDAATKTSVNKEEDEDKALKATLPPSCFEESAIPPKSNTKTSQPQKLSKGKEEYHPPGTKPGGSWFKQSYKGAQTQSASNFAFCCIGVGQAYLVSQVAMDERFVYLDQKGSQKYYSAMGEEVVGVHAPQSTLSIVPPETAKQLIQPPQQQQEQQQQKPAATESTAPPGLKEGGLWYKQHIRGGRRRMIYRPNPLGMDFYDKKGQKVNLFDGPVEPPVTMTSLLSSYNSGVY